MIQTQQWGMLARDTAWPREALEWIRRGDPFDIAILDMHMPEMDGVMLAKEIRRIESTSPLPHPKTQLPLVMLTSLGRREAGHDDALFAAYLTKPIKPSALFDALIGIFADQHEPAPSQEAKMEIDAHMGQQRPLRILLAEDNNINQKLALGMLGRLGYRADVAANGLEVLDALERQAYDVVLMDVQMTEMDGLEASRRICVQYPRERRPRIIGVTANALQGDRDLCLAAGMDDYITKPIRFNELIEALNRTQPLRASETSGTQTTVQAAPAVDRAELDAMREAMGTEFVCELIDAYLVDTPPMLAELRDGAARGDAERVRLTAHTFKANSASLGAKHLAELSRSLEAMSREGKLSNAVEHVLLIEQEYQRVTAELRAMRQS
jgi:CheY-like chemotaxis protein